MEARYGLDAATDLFSPGYTEFELSCGETKVLQAWVGEKAPADFPEALPPLESEMEPVRAAEEALKVHREDHGAQRRALCLGPYLRTQR